MGSADGRWAQTKVAYADKTTGAPGDRGGPQAKVAEMDGTDGNKYANTITKTQPAGFTATSVREPTPVSSVTWVSNVAGVGDVL